MDAIAGPVYATETEQLRASVRRLMRLAREAEAELDRLQPVADLDDVLPILNRRAFVRELADVVSYSRRYKIQSSLLCIEVHCSSRAVDDHDMRDAAGVILQDTRRIDIVGRLSATMIGIVLMRCDFARSHEVADRLQAALLSVNDGAGRFQRSISISIGAARIDGTAASEIVIRKATLANSSVRQAMMSGSN